MSINTYYNNTSSNYNNYLNALNTSSSGIYDLLKTANSSSLYQSGSVSSMTDSAKNFLLGAKSSSEDLKTSLYNLLGTNKTTANPFANSKASSANTDFVDVKSVDSSKAVSKSDIQVKVEQLAETQQNSGTNMKAEGLATDNGFTAGANQIKLESGGKTYMIDFTVSQKDTVEKVQQKIADAINGKNAGVKASVSFDSKAGTSALNLESTSSGVNYEGEVKFSVSDVASKGGAATLTGVNEISQTAQNAQYRVSNGNYTGALQTSKTNEVSIGNGVTATLKGVGSTTVKMEKGVTEQLNGVRSMVNSFNKLFELVSDNKDDKRTKSLYNGMSGLIKTYSSSLERIGISTNKSGYLQIDEDKMKKAAESGELEKFFKQNGSQSSYGFANRLTQTAEKVSKDPESYVSDNPINYVNFNSNQISMYNRFVGASMLFDMMF